MIKDIGATTKRHSSKKPNIADVPKSEKPKCEVGTEMCSGSLMAKFRGKKKGDPEFWCCGACMVMLKRQGLKSSSLERIG